MIDKRDVQAFFDRLAPDWDAGMVRNEAVIARILDNAGACEGCTVLDVACGTGVLFGDYVKRGAARVTAVDLSPEMAARAAETRLGLLADSRMRKGKIMCHALFDALWRGKPKARRKRDALYEWLAGQMGLPLADCHFGYFDLQQLRQVYRLLSDVQGLPMRYDNRGRIFFEERRSA